MSNEYEISNHQMQQKLEGIQDENRYSESYFAPPVSNLIVNTVGPDLSIPGQQDEKKPMAYGHNQQQNFKQSFPPTQYNNIQNKGGVHGYPTYNQMGENAYGQQWGYHQPVMPPCCCFPYFYYRYYPYEYRFC